MTSSLVNNKYRITRRIGGGSFGEIYMGVGPNNEKVAVKFERHGTRCPQLRHEYKVYRELINCHGFCSVYHFGTQDNYNVMVMDLLGPSLEDLFNKCNRRFSLKTVLQIADQMLERADTLHSRHLIHRDIKPANFVIGIGDTSSYIFCVDFGLSKRYRHPKNLHHIPHRDGRSLTGTPRYASINNHLGIEQSRRDDLESIGYVLIYFLKGSLPWQGLKAKNAQKKYRLILEKKQQVSIAQLCQGCPSQFAEFLAYTRSLKFDAKPDIPYLRKLFRDLYHAQGCGSVPKLWDWDPIDADYLSTTGSTGGGGGGGGPPVGALPAQPTASAGVRPTTAAAVAAPGVALESDLLLGGAGADDMGNYGGGGDAGDGRPSTAGAMMTGGYNRSASGAAGSAQQQTSSWGYSRQTSGVAAGGGIADGSGAGMGKSGSGSGLPDYGGTEGLPAGQRRPHTAHGARATGSSGGAYEGEEGDAVVAGARGMMRYRRNRATTMEPAPTQLPVQVGYGTGGGQVVPSTGQAAPWAVYQSSGKSAGQANSAMRKDGGWPNYTATDRPKSANFTGSSGSGAGAAGNSNLMASLTGAGRPSSSTQGMSAGGQWGNGGGSGTGSGSAGGMNRASNTNTLSYGSLKNRFLSGSGKASGGGAVVSGAATGSTNGNGLVSGGGSSGGGNLSTNGSANGKASGKLFSLAR